MAASFFNVPLGLSTWKRDYGGDVEITLLNRFFEQDPTSSEDPTGLLARPGTDFVKAFGNGPLRGLFSQEGFFDSDLFIASGAALIRWDSTTETAITGALAGDAPISFTYQASPGVERLWLADGTSLQYYEGEMKAQGSLDATAQVSDGDTVEIGSVYYRFSTANVDDNAPAGTMTNPWRVLIGVDLENSIANLGAAIDNSGTPGGTYSTALTAHPNVETRRVEPARLQIQAKVAGAAGNTITTTETGATISWGAATLQNGGDHRFIVVPVPEGEGNQKAVSVTTLAGHVIVSVAGSQRMYFIRPGEFWVELFAEAESEPDEVLEVTTVGDVFWALGQSTIEPWSPTGDAETPFAPIIGRALKYGILSGSAKVIDNDIVYTDTKGIVRNSSGARLSSHSIEEQIRLRG